MYYHVLFAYLIVNKCGVIIEIPLKTELWMILNERAVKINKKKMH